MTSTKTQGRDGVTAMLQRLGVGSRDAPFRDVPALCNTELGGIGGGDRRDDGLTTGTWDDAEQRPMVGRLMMQMDRKIVLVIGGSSGIGHEIARQTSAQGARLIIVGRTQAKLTAAAERLGGEVTTAVLDAHDDTALEHFFARLDAVDHLVSMVGDSMAGGFLTTSPETMRHVLHSKFWANWMIARYAAPKLRDGGSMTFTAGGGGRAQDIAASYVANLGVGALVQGLASELAPHVRVNAVAPTFMGTGTAFWKDVAAEELERMQVTFRENVPLQRLGTAEEVASAYVHLMANGFITGQVLAVDGGVMLRK